jgi:hypothetical protein
MIRPTMVVSLTVVSTEAEHITRAAEVMARAAAGLALEGIMVNLSLGTPSDADDEGQ